MIERRTLPLSIDTMRGSLPKGGTVLGTKRGSPWDRPGGIDEVHRTFADLGLEALIVVGGNGSLTVAHRLATEEGLPIVGVPKTIDNDIVGTDVTFGFHTAVQIATEAIDRLHTTAESHDRVMVVEVMGRHSGWIAAYAGIAGGATVVLIPEIPFDIDKVCAHLNRRHDKGRYASIVVVAEGAEPIPGTLPMADRVLDQFGHVRLGGIADVIARELGDRTGFETRVVMLGHVQRGGTPTAFDRVLSTRFGVAAIDLVHEGGWGQMVVARGIRDRPRTARARRRQDQAARHVALPRRRRDLLRVGFDAHSASLRSVEFGSGFAALSCCGGRKLTLCRPAERRTAASRTPDGRPDVSRPGQPVVVRGAAPPPSSSWWPGRGRVGTLGVTGYAGCDVSA